MTNRSTRHLGRRRLIAVLGNGQLDDADPRALVAEALGRALVAARYRILCGARGGVMASVARGGRSSEAWVDGDILGLLPGPDASVANPYVDVVLPTGLGEARNALIARADAVIAIGGGAGTLSELALAWTYGRPCLAFRCQGWSGRLADTALDDKRDDVVHGVDTPEEAIRVLGQVLEVV